ncbi:carboxypeptidase Taq [Palleronia aestuarii]|uniref:Metal-dependent carboxypeptidase n=1 Tax=Palleronia aestuarii TaxID=568105 RepID=A0A2W7QDE4_9RHOB|nr:carboxypeptidase M32 [Palleronia aestuarii]PZX19889.1 carboxypeptidase Taq [Palleronia aestuarii]
MSAYDDLMAFQRETEALGEVAGRLGWDQETVMPLGAAEQRADEIAALEGVLHARRVDPRIGEWLEAAKPEGEVAAAQLRHIRRVYERTARVPARLAAELARVTSVSQGQWARARATDDFAAFAPVLENVVALKREEADCLAAGGDPYDALLDDFEPGATAANLSEMFGALRPRLVALRDAALASPVQPAALEGEFPETGQLEISRRLAIAFGYDFTRGRIDKAVHPFSSGSGNDVRITTRTAPLDPFNCFYSTVHEVGHAAYEQGVDPAYALTPLGRGVSMGVHESQSRIYENQLGRSQAFTGWLHSQMSDVFGDLDLGAGAFYGAVNRLHRGFIRTESDEVQYNLHVLLRFDLERQLIAGSLAVGDLEEAWNARFEADFGYPVERASQGVLQDVHWSVGLFGYFPTYTLGNVYAGCLYRALREAVPDLEADLSQGETAAATGWLREHLQRHGGLYPPRETVERACGFAPNEEPLLDYLEEKFGAIYGL